MGQTYRWIAALLYAQEGGIIILSTDSKLRGIACISDRPLTDTNMKASFCTFRVLT